MGLKVIITGGAGFIGSNFVRRTLQGAMPGISEVRVIDKLTYAGTIANFSKKELENLDLVEGDICDSDLISKSIKGFDAVINFAAESHVDRSITRARDFVMTNVLGTQTLLDCTRNLGLENFVQVSTDEVYGSIPQGSWDEEEPLLPNSPYAASKASADLMVRAAFKTHKLNVKITRCSNNYGPHQFPEKVIPLFVTNLIENKSVPVYGTVSNIRDWLHVDDHCNGINLVLQSGKAGEIYNIGGGKELTNLDLTHRILHLLGKDETSLEYVPDRLGHDVRYSVDHSKISRELGYEPKIDFNQGLNDTIEWYKEHPEWWIPLKTK